MPIRTGSVAIAAPLKRSAVGKTVHIQCNNVLGTCRYLGAFFVKPNLNIVMEYCEAGSVADIMRYRQRTMLEPEIATIMQGEWGPPPQSLIHTSANPSCSL